jgi:hypothetical protein
MQIIKNSKYIKPKQKIKIPSKYNTTNRSNDYKDSKKKIKFEIIPAKTVIILKYCLITLCNKQKALYP